MPFILVAEDAEINRKLIRILLKNTGFHAKFAKNGRIAFEMFGKDPGKYDIILTDLNMPEMDGFEEAAKIRAMGGKGKDIPIIALTANATENDIKKCMEAGMNDHIKKPVNPEELLTKLMKYLR